MSAAVPSTGDSDWAPLWLELMLANDVTAAGHTWNICFCLSKGIHCDSHAVHSRNRGCTGDGSAEDRPAPERTYLCRAPGGFKLLSGRLRPFPRARAASTMLARPPF